MQKADFVAFLIDKMLLVYTLKRAVIFQTFFESIRSAEGKFMKLLLFLTVIFLSGPKNQEVHCFFLA